MKKIIFGLLVVLVSSFCFAKTFDDNGKIIEKFIENGKYIKIIKDENSIGYVPKNTISKLDATQDFLWIWSSGVIDGTKPGFGFSTKKYEIYLDENDNIVIKNK